MVFVKSNLPVGAQPWGRQIEKAVATLETTTATERVNNAARDAQAALNVKRLDASLQTTAQNVSDIKTITDNVFVAGTTQIDGYNIKAGTIDASAINVGTLTGFTIQTSSFGSRVEMTSADDVSFYGDDGIITGAIRATGTSGASNIEIKNFYNGGWGKNSYSSINFNQTTLGFGASNGTFASTMVLNSTGLDVSGQILGSYIASDLGGSFTGGTTTISDLSATGIIFYPGYASGLGTGTALYLSASTGGYRIGILASSRRFKENIEPLNGTYLDKISALTPVTFNYKENPTEKSFGLIAEDVDAAGLHEIVHRDVDENGDMVPFSVMYDRLAVYLIPAIKELQDRIEVLEGK